jgi:hypothetical protein
VARTALQPDLVPPNPSAAGGGDQTPMAPTGADHLGAGSQEEAALALGLAKAGSAGERATHDDGGRLTPRSTLSRILAGDLALIDEVAGRLSSDEAETDRWKARLTALCEILLQRAIDTGALAVPPNHEFWGAFTAEQGRDILSALAALGYRADGLGGWQDDRVPGQRELSIAVAHAGLDPMRIRHWPTQSEAIDLVREAEILGGEYVAAMAASLEARELRLVLGSEARRFEELWRAWDRIRPVLLEAARTIEPESD